MRLTYVTGASGAGKQKLHDQLAAAGANVRWVNDGPMPRGGHVEWLRWVAAEQLAAAASAVDAGADDTATAREHRIFVGTMWPFQLIETYTWRENMAKLDVGFVLLDRPWAEQAAELEQRLVGEDPDEIAEQIENDRRLQRQLRYQVEALYEGVAWDYETALACLRP